MCYLSFVKTCIFEVLSSTVLCEYDINTKTLGYPNLQTLKSVSSTWSTFTWSWFGDGRERQQAPLKGLFLPGSPQSLGWALEPGHRAPAVNCSLPRSDSSGTLDTCRAMYSVQRNKRQEHIKRIQDSKSKISNKPSLYTLDMFCVLKRSSIHCSYCCSIAAVCLFYI